ncbi:MAG TPA: hypothetical protein VF292_03870 [Rhodanobacteraceae bacterium]
MSSVEIEPAQSGNPEQPAWDETWGESADSLTALQQAKFVRAELDAKAEAEADVRKRSYHPVSSRPTT